MEQLHQGCTNIFMSAFVGSRGSGKWYIREMVWLRAGSTFQISIEVRQIMQVKEDGQVKALHCFNHPALASHSDWHRAERW